MCCGFALALITFVLLSCDASSPEPALERTCNRAFDRQLMLELSHVNDVRLLNEQRRLLELLRKPSVTACVERDDIADARCAADAPSLEVLVACRSAHGLAAN